MVFFLSPMLAHAVPGPTSPDRDQDAGNERASITELLLANEDPEDDIPDLNLPELDAVGDAEAVASEEYIPEAYWQAYFGERPESHLNDPQNLLGPLEYRDRLEFLNYHAGDSAIDLIVHLIGGDQQIPGEVRQEEIMERLYASGKPAVVVFYFMGNPKKTLMLMTPSVSRAVSAAERRRALECSLIQALAEADPARQFEALLMQLSIRIYGMENLMAAEVSESPAMGVTGPPESKMKNSKPVPKTSMMTLMEEARRHLVPALLLAGLLVSAWAARIWLKHRKGHVFPDFEVETRLGGAHAAGVGAVISFASATVPPASQREAMPDYLRKA